MTALAAKALELARAAIGVTEHPPGSNRGPEVDEYLRAVGLDPVGDHYPWCAAFVSAMVERAAIELGAQRRFHGNASVHRLLSLNIALAVEDPSPGCVFVHLTIEGNSDAHGSRTGGSVVAGFRRPGYATSFLVLA